MFAIEADEGGVVVKGRATIDTRPPFRSVKEAVELFGERVLVGEIYGKQLKEMEPRKTIFDKRSNITSTLEATSSELEETKKKLKQEIEEGNNIATSLKSLRHELEQTKTKLLHYKTAKNSSIKQPTTINPEIEQLNFIGNPTYEEDFDDASHQDEYHKKRVVTFASPPIITREIVHENVDISFAKLGKNPSLRKEFKEEKRKTISPILGWFNFYQGNKKTMRHSPRF